MWTLERESEIEFLKLLCIINAIIGVGNSITSAVAQSDNSGNSDTLSKSIESLQKMMLPHRGEDTDRKVAKYKEIMSKEYAKGEIQVVAMEHSKPKNRKMRITKVR